VGKLSDTVPHGLQTMVYSMAQANAFTPMPGRRMKGYVILDNLART